MSGLEHVATNQPQVVLARDLKRKGEKRRARLVERRRCGECRACCEMRGRRPYVPAPEVNGACPLLCEKGCGIYATRPETCRQYLCGWRAGLGVEGDRPDRGGWLLDIISEGVHSRTPRYIVRFVATGPHATLKTRDELAARCGAWFRSLPADQIASVVTIPWRS